jgi:hypothetical protein
VNQFTLAPLNPKAQIGWHYCVIGAFTSFSKRVQTQANGVKRKQVKSSCSSQQKWTLF